MNRKKYSDNQKRALILEKRLARLENLIKNEAKSKKFESFESDLDEEGARAAADRLANQFASMVGVKLTPDLSYEYTIDSPVYGALNPNSSADAEDVVDDPDARFTFGYNVVGYPADTVKIRPTDGTICVWRSIYDGYYGEGAVDPKTGECEWEDWLGDCSYPLRAWKNFNFDMIHGDEDDWDDDDEYDESLKRRIARLEKTISSKRSTVESKRTSRRLKNR